MPNAKREATSGMDVYGVTKTEEEPCRAQPFQPFLGYSMRPKASAMAQGSLGSTPAGR
jgi:hypothetical protein